MRKHSEKTLRLFCLALGALLLFQVVRLVVRKNPLAGLSIPALPTFTVATDPPAGGKGTNAASARESANKGTNVVGRQSGSKDTNSVAGQPEGKRGTNSLSSPETNAVAARPVPKGETNPTPEQAEAASNSPAQVGRQERHQLCSGLQFPRPGRAGQGRNECCRSRGLGGQRQEFRLAARDGHGRASGHAHEAGRAPARNPGPPRSGYRQ